MLCANQRATVPHPLPLLDFADSPLLPVVSLTGLQILSNAVLLVDKPARWSSADVVRQLQSALKVDKVCFGAPLDMEATGLLIILLGRCGPASAAVEAASRRLSKSL